MLSRHSFPHNYAGDFSAVIVPVRHPMTWLVSYYDFFSTRPAEVWQPGRFYAQKGFGSPMPPSFELFVKHVVELDLASDYWHGFVDGGTHFIRQEVLRSELSATLYGMGHMMLQLHEMDWVEPKNVGIPRSTWSEVDDRLIERYEDQTQWIVDRFYGSESNEETSDVVVEVVE